MFYPELAWTINFSNGMNSPSQVVVLTTSGQPVLSHLLENV